MQPMRILTALAAVCLAASQAGAAPSRGPTTGPATQVETRLPTVPANQPTTQPAVAPETQPATQPATALASRPAVKVANGPITARAGRTFRFQYDGAPLGQIVRAFTQAAGKPLLPPPEIPGKLTFYDAEPYAYDEAFDMLNILLGMQGFMLREQERYFQLLPLADVQKQPQLRIIKAGQDQTDIRASEVVSMVIPLKFIDATSAANAVVRMISTFGSIAPLTKGKGIVITDRMANIKRVQALLAELDVRTLNPTQIEPITLRNASASSVATTINNLFAPQRQGRRVWDRDSGQFVQGPESEDTVTAAADERTNMLILMGVGDKLIMAQQMVEKLDANMPATSGDIKIFTLKNAKAEELANTIRQLLPQMQTTRYGDYSSQRYYGGYGGYGGGYGGYGGYGDSRYGVGAATGKTTEVRVVADAATNRLIVSAPVDQMTAIEKLVKELDDASVVTAGAQIFRLKVADAQQLSGVITNALSKRDPRGYMVSQLSVSADPRTNSLIILGPAGDLQTAAKLIEELDQAQKDPREIHVVQLKAGDARQVADSLMRLFTQQVSRGRFGGYGTESTSNLRVEAETASNSLIIASAPGDWPAIQNILEQIKANIDPQTTPTTRLVKLQNVRASELAQTLMQIYGPQRRSAFGGYGSYGQRTQGGPQQVPVTIAPSDSSNSLLISAADEDQKSIAELIKSLDVPPTDGGSFIQMIALKNAQAETLAETLRAMLPPPARGQAQEVYIEADKTTNSILVRAPETERKTVTELIDKLDKATIDQTREMRIIPLQFASASAIASMLNDLYQNVSVAPRGATRRPRGFGMAPAPVADAAEQVIITPAPHDKAIVVDAPKKKIEEIARLVASMDVKEAEGRLQMRTYQLANSSAAEVARSLGRLFAEQRGARTGLVGAPGPAEPRFEADTVTNQLMVAGTESQLEKVDEFVKKLQEGMVLASQTKTFKMKFAKAEELADLLQSMLTDAAGRRTRTAAPGGDIPTRVAAMTATNSVVVQGPPDQIALAEELIKTFDTKEAAEGQSVIQIVQLKNAQATTLAEAVNAALQKKASAGGLSRRPGQGQASPDQVIVTPETNSNTVLVRGPAPEVPAAIEMIKKLDDESEAGATQIRVVRVEKGDAAELAKSLSKTFQDVFRAQPRGAKGGGQVPFSISADERTNSLVVYATPAHYALVQKTLDDLALAPEKPSREMNYFWLDSADATQVATKLNAMYASLKGPEKPFIEADTLSNSVSVIADAAHLLEIEAVVLKLDEMSKSTNVQVRVVPLTGVRAEKLASVLQRIFPQTTGNKVVVTEQLPPRITVKNRETQEKEIQFPQPSIMPPEDKQVGPTTQPASAVKTPAAPLVSEPATQPTTQPTTRSAEATTAPAETPPVTIAVDKAANALIICATRQQLDLIDALIKQLTTTDVTAESDMRIFEIKQADPGTIAQTLDALFNPRVAAPQQQGQGGGARAGGRQGGQAQTPQVQAMIKQQNIVAVADMRTRSVIVRAKMMDMENIETLIKALDQVGQPSEVRVFTLKNTDATELASNVRELFQVASRSQAQQAMPVQGQQGTGQQRRVEMIRQFIEMRDADGVTQVDLTTSVNISANRVTNSVIVSAPADAMKLVEKIVQELDQSAALGKMPSVRMYPLKNAEVRTTVTTLQQIFSSTPGAAAGAGGQGARRVGITAIGEAPITVAGDEAGRLVIVSAPADKQELVAAVIKEIDAAAGVGDVTVVVYRILHADAASVATAINGAFGGSGAVVGRGGRGGGAVQAAPAAVTGAMGNFRVTADTSSNSVVVRANKEDHLRIKALIDELDKAATQGALAIVKLYPLKYADVRTTVTALQQVFSSPTAAGGRGRGQGAVAAPSGTLEPQPVITGDEVGKLVIVSAAQEKQELIAKVIDEIDKAQVDLLVLKVYKIEHADATSLASALIGALTGTAGAPMGGGRGGRAAQGGAAGVATPSGQFRITADVSSNSLLVRASKEDHQKIKDLVDELDKAADPTKLAEVKFYQLKNAEVRATVTALQQIFASQTAAPRGRQGGPQGAGGALQSQPIITGDEVGKLVIVSAAAEKQELIAKVIEEIDKANDELMQTLKVYRIEYADAASMASALTSVLTGAQGAAGRTGRTGAPAAAGGGMSGNFRISADTSSNSLLVRASKEDHEKIAKWILDLDQSAGKTKMAVVKLYPLTNADVRTTVTSLQQIFAAQTAAGRARGAATASTLEPPPVITGDEAGRLIIVSAAAEKQDLIAKVISDIDEKNSIDPLTVQVYKVQYADAAGVASALNGALTNAAAGGGTRVGPASPGASNFRITADPSSNTLVVRATKEDHDKIGKLIVEMDVAPLVNYPVQMIPLTNADATNIATVLKSVFASPGATAGATGAGRRALTGPMARGQIVIEADRDSRMLMVRADDDTFKKIREVVAKLDAAPAVGRATQTVIQLKNGLASSVASSVQAAFVPQRGKATNPDELVTVVAEPVSNSLILTANPENMKKVELLVETLEKGSQAGAPRTEFMILTNAKAVDMADVLSKIASSSTAQGAGRTGPRGGAIGPRTATVSADAASNALVFSGPSEDVDALMKMARKLDDAAAITGVAVVKLYPLKNADVQTTVTNLQQIFATTVARTAPRGTAQTPAGKEPPIVIVGDEVGRQVIVSAPPDKHTLIAATIKEIDDSQTEEVVSVKVYKIQNADATTLASALSATITGQGRTGVSTTPIRISADRGSNSLVVRAAQKEHEKIALLIQEMDTSVVTQFPVKLIPINNADPVAVAQMINKTFGAAATGKGGTTPGRGVTAEATSDTRMIAVRADEETFPKIHELVTQLDASVPGIKATRTNIQLKNADASSIAAAITAAFAPPRGRAINPDDLVTVIAEPVSNCVIVTANAENFKKVKLLVDSLDLEETSGIKRELVFLKNAKAADVATTLSKIVLSGTTGKAGAKPATTVSAEPGTNALVFSGPANDLNTLMKMAQQLDLVAETSATSTYIIPLKNGMAATVAEMVRSLYTQMKSAAAASKQSVEAMAVSSDDRANALVLVTSKDMYAQVSEWVQKLEQMTPARGNLRLITLEHADPTEVDKAIQQLFNQTTPAGTTVTPVRSGPGTTPPRVRGSPGADKVGTSVMPKQRSILVSASDEDYETILKLAKALDEAAARAKATVRIVPLKNAQNNLVATAVTAHYRAANPSNAPELLVTVTALPQTVAVLVAATQDKMDEVVHLIEELDKTDVSPLLEFRIYPLKNATPTKIMPMLQQMLAQVKALRPTEAINVQADDRTKSVIVTARGGVFDQVKTIIESLDKPPTFEKADVLIIPLKRADAQQLATVLNEMLRPGVTGQITPEARALQEQVRLLRVRSTVAEKIPELDLEQPIKISSDPAKPQGSNSLIMSSTPDNLKALQAIVEIMDIMPLTEGVKARLIVLKNADATSVATILTQIFTQGKQLAGKPGSTVAGRAEPDTATGKALVNVLTAVADMRTNTLVLGGLEETVALAEIIAKDLDRVDGQIVTEVRLFRLKDADATKLAPLLQAVFAESVTTVPGAEGLRTQVTRLQTVLDKGQGNTSTIPKTRAALTIQADASTNILIVAARNDVMPLIADVIQTMDIPGAGSLNAVRIYPLVNADATRLQTVITALHTGPNATLIRAEDKPTVTVDTRTNALIISASDKTFAVLETLLKALDAKVPIDVRDIRLVPLKNAEAATLATNIQKMMDARVQRLATLGAKDSEALRAIILADERSNSLIVGASAESFDLVKSLAEQLDGAGMALAGQIQLFQLKEADAGTLSTLLTNLFTQRYAAVVSPDLKRQKPVILSDLRTNSLLVAANQDDTKVLTALLDKMDMKLVDPSVLLEVIPMKNNDAGLISTMLQQLFAARLTSMTPAGTTPAPSARVDVRFDSLSNALIVSANKENMGLIRELLKKVDIEPPVESGVVKMFPLKTADAATTTALLQSLIQQGLYKPGVAVTGANAALAAREKISIVSDFRTNTIIVSASKENLAIVEQLIKQMDIDAPWALGDIRVFILKNADCTKLGPMIQQFYTQKRASELAVNTGAKLMSVVVTADARTNALLVTGPKDAFAGIEAMVKQLDAEQVAILSDFKVFYLKQATASSIQPTLQQLFAQRVARGGVKDPVTIIADQKTNSLIVGATPDDLKVAEALITKLDSAPDSAGNKVYIFPLSKADATQVANTLKSLLQTQGGAVTGAAATPGMGISVDERMNAIVVSAGAGDVKRIEEIIKQLDTDAVANVTEIRVFTLKNADATELSTLLTLALTNKPKAMTTVSPNRQTLLQFIGRTKDGKDLITSALQEGVMITPDRRTNSLVVSAPKENMPLLESLIQAMDSTTPRMAEIKVFTLQNADAAKMALVLTQLFRLQATGGLGTTSTAVNYTLTTTQPSGDKGSSSVTVGTADQYALSVTVDGRTNSLVVGGTQHYVEMVSKIIQELDSSPTQDRMTQVYRLRNARAADVQTALRAFLDYERQRETAALGADRIGAAQRLMEQEVAVVAVNFEGAATNANTLLLAASPRYFKTVFDMIKELDQPPPQVLIQVLLAEVSLDETTDLGIDWQFSKTHHGKTTSIGTNFGAQGLLNTSGFSLSVTGSDLSMFLHALQSEGRVQVLQRPQIIAADNRQSKLIVGQRRPFVTASRITDTGQTINTIEYQDVSLTLTVTPRINPEGFVKLDIDQKIDDVNPSTTEVTPGVPAIVIDTRQAVTTVTVQDGHTIVIGGIITTKDTNQEKKVPLLGDIPLLGNLFKSTSVTKKRSELLIILTPHVVRSAADSDTTTNRQLERMNKYRDKNYRPGNELMNLIDLVSPLRSANAEWQDLLPRMSETQPTTMPLEALPELERRAATQPAIQPKDTPP